MLGAVQIADLRYLHKVRTAFSHRHVVAVHVFDDMSHPGLSTCDLWDNVAARARYLFPFLL